MTSVLTLRLKVNPRSSRDRIVGWMGDRLKIAVSAAPEDGKANDAVLRLLSWTLGIAPSRIRILSGKSASEKDVALYDVDAAKVLSRLPPGHPYARS